MTAQNGYYQAIGYPDASKAAGIWPAPHPPLLPTLWLGVVQPGQECVVGGKMLVIVDPAVPGPVAGRRRAGRGGNGAVRGGHGCLLRADQARDAGPARGLQPAMAAGGRAQD